MCVRTGKNGCTQTSVGKVLRSDTGRTESVVACTNLACRTMAQSGGEKVEEFLANLASKKSLVWVVLYIPGFTAYLSEEVLKLLKN